MESRAKLRRHYEPRQHSRWRGMLNDTFDIREIPIVQDNALNSIYAPKEAKENYSANPHQ